MLRPRWSIGLASRRLAVVAAGVTLALSLAAAASATGLITAKEIGSFSLADQVGYPAGHTFRATLAPGSLVDTVTVRVPPGGSFGWHSHNATVVVTMTAGSLALYDPSCDRQVVTAGQGFVEEPGVMHLARNEGSTLAVLTVTYLGVPAGQPEDVFAPPDFDPCHGIQ